MRSANSHLSQHYLQFVSKLRESGVISKIRPLSHFTSQTVFSRPHSIDEATARLELNLKYFAVNYALILLVLLVIVLLFNPLLLIVVALAAVGSAVKEFNVGPYSIQGRPKQMAILGLSALLVFLLAGTTLLVILGISSLIVIAHALMHDTMVDTDLEADTTELVGRIPDDDSFEK